MQSYFDENPHIIFGVTIEEKTIPIANISTEIQNAAVTGEIVSIEYKGIVDDRSVCSLILTDYDNSVTVKFFIRNENLHYVEPRLKEGEWITVFGSVQYDRFQSEDTLFAIDINTAKKEIRRDNAPVKRTELHLHTRMSALDAITPATELIKRAAYWGHPAIAITDHGVIQAFPEAYAAGKKNNIKIIYGVEGYLFDEADNSKSYHIILLVQNSVGLKNLYNLITLAHLNHFYKKPRFPRNEIINHREGIIIGSACEAGELYRAIISGEDEARLTEIAAFYDYLEIQPVGNNMFLIKSGDAGSAEDIKNFNNTVCRLGEAVEKPVVATCDVHFMDKEDEIYRKVLFAGQDYTDADNQPPLYFRTTEEMLTEFSYLGTDKAYEVVVKNTNLINGMIEDGVAPIPEGMYAPEMQGAEQELRTLAETKAREVYGDVMPELVCERLERELDAIISNGFSVMYMIAHKLVKKSNDDGYFVGSRGSVGSSFVAAMTGITEVNPLVPHFVCPVCKRSDFITDGSVASGFDLPQRFCECGAEFIRDGQNIPFETFLGLPGTEKAPDIDLNFSGEYQASAHKYTEELFGNGYVFRAGTIATIADKTAYAFADKYAEKYVAPIGKSLSKAERHRLAKGCEGVKRTTSQHPGGIIVIPSDRDVHDFTPLQHPADARDSGVITTHFDFHSLHDTVLKLDILGHDDPSIIKMLEDLTKVKANEIKPNDPTIMSLFLNTEALGVTPEDIGSETGTFGLPEFGTRFVRQMLVESRPKSFSDLLQISGLSHGKDVWIKNAQDLVSEGTCTISDVIGTRDNIMVYLMYRGLEPSTAFKIMEGVRKGLGIKPEFERLMAENGVPEWYISSCKKIKYMFPKAHAVAYVLMAYRQAWYKIYRPLAYYAAYFSIRGGDFDAELMTRGAGKAKDAARELNKKGTAVSQKEKNLLTLLELVVEMNARGIAFLPVDIYVSHEKNFLIEGDGLRPPLTSLSGIGESAAVGIAAAREGGKYISIEDFAFRTKAGKNVVDVLREYGCFKGMDESSQMSFF